MFVSPLASTSYAFSNTGLYFQELQQHNYEGRRAPAPYHNCTNYKKQPGRRSFTRHTKNPRAVNTGSDLLLDDSMAFPSPPQRTFEELHAEKSYLLRNLQAEDKKSTHFLRHLSRLEESLTQATPYDRRTINKQLHWVRTRLRESKRQEKAILARLGDITFDVQMKERWAHIENERREQQLFLAQQPVFFQAPAIPFADCMSPFGVPYWVHIEPSPTWSPSGRYYPEAFVPMGESPEDWRQSYDYSHQGEQLDRSGLAENSENSQDSGRPIDDGELKASPIPVGRSQSMGNIWSDLSYAATDTVHFATPVPKRQTMSRSLESSGSLSRKGSRVDDVELDDARIRLMGYHV
ncbi:hypothetical protein PVAG01_08284 [Phlyctema vagabunda]|uniref:Uncharacterized protein n=1 Tax=Phlyctema vagabunda TaxID=108571 RepID=A0ABR4P8Z2_9HELO